MGNRTDARLEQLRRRMGGRSNALKLARAAFGDVDDALAHAECLAALPTYVDAEIDGARVAEEFSNVKRHLDLCEGCAMQYAELLEVALANQASQIPTTVTIPKPDLSFLAP